MKSGAAFSNNSSKNDSGMGKFGMLGRRNIQSAKIRRPYPKQQVQN